MANQFTKAAEKGLEKPAGANQFTTGKREGHDEATRDKMRAERAAIVLESIMGDDGATKAEKIAAAKSLIPFGKATLSSVESKQAEPWQDKSEEELLGLVQALITAHPQLASKLNIGLRPVQAVDNSSDLPESHRSNAA